MIRASRVVPGALACLLALLATLAACRDRIELGDGPDAGDASADVAEDAASCTSTIDRTLVTVADSSRGDLRAIAVAAGTLWVLSARADNGMGVLSRVPVEGGALTAVAQLGLEPVALSVSADGRYAFVVGSAQIARVDATGTIVLADAGGVPAGVVAGDQGRAYWTLPANDSVQSWNFTTGAPAKIVTTPHATSLARDGQTLYITGQGALYAFQPASDAAVRLVSPACDHGIPAVAGSVLFCAMAGSIARVDLGTGGVSIIATAQTGASDVVVGGGRAFWRAAESTSTSFVIAAPIDGVSGPTVLESAGRGALLVASDACSLYFTDDRAIWRRGF